MQPTTYPSTDVILYLIEWLYNSASKNRAFKATPKQLLPVSQYCINIIYIGPTEVIINLAIIISELQPLTVVVSVENDPGGSLAGGELSAWENVLFSPTAEIPMYLLLSTVIQPKK